MKGLEEFSSITWLAPWEAVGPGLEEELAREVGAHHVLFRRPAISMGRRVDRDDVLFLLPEGPVMLAVVHLTWTGRLEARAEYPAVVLFSSVEEFIERCMKPDHMEYSN